MSDALRWRSASPERGAGGAAEAPPRGYWALSRTMTYSLLLALPLFALYELLARLVNRGSRVAVRNAADSLLRGLFSPLGADAETVFVSVLAAVAIVLIVRERRRHPVPIRLGVLGGMWLESAALAVAFGLVVTRITAMVLSPLAAGPAVGASAPAATLSAVSLAASAATPITAQPSILLAASPPGLSTAQMLVLSLGAGLYEELVFRVLLVSAVAAVIRRLLPASRVLGGVLAVLVAALFFSLFHYVGPYGDEWALSSFTFRFVGGVAFSTIYVLRGFGIVAWTHALYDVLLLTMLAATA
ncbi:MAG: CPBP family intramembrane glutamic endopeptidase [Anaerolineae bacterium]